MPRKRSVTTVAATDAPSTLIEDGKTQYRVRDGIEWVNGERLKGRDTVRLTTGEAVYELAVGTILPIMTETPDL